MSENIKLNNIENTRNLIIEIKNGNSLDCQIKKANSGKAHNNLDYISFAKIISAYGVIILHTNPFWNDNYKNVKKWIFANFIEQVFFFSVPFFVLCIGATLLDFNEKYSLKIYYKRRFTKVVVPLVGWNIFSYYYRIYFVKNLKKKKFDIIYLLNLFFQNKLYGLFYSFHIFIVTYMIIPILAYVEKPKKIYIYFYGFFTLLITQILIPYLLSIFNINMTWPYRIDVGYIIYIFSGYIIQNYKFSKTNKIIIYILGLFFFLVQFISTQYYTYKNQKIYLLHTGFLKFPTIIYCNSLFLFIKEYSDVLFKVLNKNFINKLGSLTIGPFFLHWPVIDFFQKYPKLIFNMNLFSFIGGSFICIICFLITFILKQIPIIKYLVP